MSEKEVASIPFFVHEATVERLERINKRWFIMALVVFILFVLTNAGWIVYESQFVTYEIEQDVKAQDATALVTGIGDVTHGAYPTEDQGQGAENQR